jgi:lysophospholipase L1-like esterase
MPNLTQNYKLEKPLVTENYDINVHNRNSDKVDSKIKEIDDRVNEIIVTPAEGVTAQEIIDARGGEKNLGAKLRKVDEYLAEKAQINDVRLKSVLLGQNDMTQEFIQQMAGTTPVNAVVADGAVTPVKTSFFQLGKNLFDKSKVTIGYYVSETTGNLGANASYNVSDYIAVSENTIYSLGSNANTRVAFYNSAKTFISGIKPGVNPITTPVGTAFVRYSFDASTLNSQQFELGSVRTTYEAYRLYISKEKLEKTFEVNDIPDGGIESSKIKFIKTGKNIFNKDTVTAGYYVSSTVGTLVANANYVASDYIPVSPSAEYTQSYGGYMAFYDSAKKYISGLGLQSSARIFTTPSNAAYIRVSSPVANLSTYQVELGNTATLFEPYGIKLVDSLLEKVLANDSISVFLPSEICVAVGRTIELYNKQVALCGNINNFHFKWDCPIGKSLKRKFSITGVSGNIGSHTLTLTVFNGNMVIVATATTTIKVVSNSVSTARNILTIGDSLTNNKPWLGELRTLSSDMFTMVGTRGTSPLKHEGRSGFAASSYLSGSAYTFENEGIHPFWDGTRFNWNYYKTNTGINPDAVQIFLGTNTISTNPSPNADNIKQIVDYIRQDDSTIPIYVVYTLYRGNQDGLGVQSSSDGYSVNTGAWKYEEDLKVFNLMVKLNELLSSYTNLYFVPIALAHDSEYNFGAVETPVNPRAFQTELMPTEATHPQNQGYMQFADIMFSVMAAH